MNEHPLKQIVQLQKQNIPKGICSVCSANPIVIEAALKRGKELDQLVLIEATANQVNQDGGYTSMRPIDFRVFVESIARRVGFELENLILGGDHLGPLTWRNLKTEDAMDRAEILVTDYVKAGFTKIHIDTSMKLGDDRSERLDNETIAYRGARLIKACEEAYELYRKDNPLSYHPVYVVGSEVPFPGGAQEDESIYVTSPGDLDATICAYKKVLNDNKLDYVWQNIIAIVVQPGVEFGHNYVDEYNRDKAQTLVEALRPHTGIIFEGHSTDYQRPKSLKEMVEDKVGILKVGPGLTFALRESLYALSHIENELIANPMERSNIICVIEDTMIHNPENWIHHYHGVDKEVELARKYSFYDRIRYYFTSEAVEAAINKLIYNLTNVEVPLTLLSQYVPIQYHRIREGDLFNNPYDILLDSVIRVLDDYYFAVLPPTSNADCPGEEARLTTCLAK